ncbi:PhzF family phenazine biosynthesis protein [Hwanghaeella grinnelliae]|uniref:PhzF family phenazine biosynthesis protein n=1 Tax=Hwanghaeella grinnelliae TaxID=2500179 RepID=A0A3S2W209_9PROT|nr:PhzF family phenazine biosynthesis protein [Hwanghaeella grinnelliae]RVU33794.1 PhzF family phenazine biosynthesis protein [Hwanghaeella grinnelliae]
MELTIFQVDAFTDRVFAGNPAAVIPLSEWLPDNVLQSLALENNLSETAFFVPTPTDPNHDFHLRWFTPAIEVDLCGHATLASAAVLYRELGWSGDEIRFKALAGDLVVRKKGALFELDFPARAPKADEPPEGFVEALGTPPREFYKAKKFMAVLENEAAVLAVDPDMDFIAGMQGDGLIVTAPGRSDGSESIDCVSRYFAPHAGIPEDPVTGSAHCTIIPYWAEKLGKMDINAKQISARGGDLYCTLAGDRVLIAGQAVLYMKGAVHVGDGWSEQG